MSALFRSSLASLVLVVAACSRPTPPDLAQSLAGVPSADALSGVRLGMSAAELRKVRPALGARNGRMLDTLDGFVRSYALDKSTPDSVLVAVWTTREFESPEALAAAWDASLSNATAHLGRPMSCYASPAREGSTEIALHAAMWEAGGVQLSAMTTSRRRATSAMFYDAARAPHDRHNVFELSVYRRGVWENAMTSLSRVVVPRPSTACGAPGRPSTVALGVAR